LPQSKVSLTHARIERKGDAYQLIDEDSTNGTRLNGSLVTPRERMTLRDGDRIGIGDFLLEVSVTEVQRDNKTESSTSIARQMVRAVLDRLGPGQSQPYVEVLDGASAGTRFEFPQPGQTYVVGYGPAGEVRLDDVDMWREHAAL